MRPPGQPRSSRSRQMIQLLRQEFVYAEKRVRDILFEEIDAALGASDSPPIVSKLARDAASRGRARSQEAGFEFQNWDTASKATINAMLGARALLTLDGRPIPLTVAAQATPVAGLVPGFRDVTESHLLELLIGKLGDITARDHVALAHALFRQFDKSVAMEDMEDRVAHLLAGLAGRVTVTRGGAYCVLDCPVE